MFTDEQLAQLAKVIDERLDTKLEPIKKQLNEQGKDIQSLKGDVQTLQHDVQSVKSEVEKQSKDIKIIKKNVDVLIIASNRDDMRLQKRVKRIEDHLGLPPLEEHPGVTG